MDDENDSQAHGAPRRRAKPRTLADQYPGLSWLVHGTLVAALCAIMLWAPIPLGSNRPFYLSLLALATGVTLALWAAAAAPGVIRVSHKLPALWPAALAFAVAMLFAAFQIVDLKDFDQVLGTSFARDLGHPIWQLAGESLGQNLPSYVTINPAKAEPAFLKAFIYAGIFLLAFVLSRQSGSAKFILTIAAVSAGLSVVLGLGQNAAGFNIGGSLSGETVTHVGRFGSTFANPNHFATFAGVGLIAAIGLAYDALSRGVVFNRGREIALRTAMATVMGPALPGIACAMLLSGAIFMSASRAGSLAMLAGCATLAAILYLTGRSSQRGQGSPLTMWMLGAIVLAGVVAASAPMLSRVKTVQIADDMRGEIAMTTIDAVIASPWAGNGFGAFANYYPLYASGSEGGTVNKAHNDYLEALSDLGVIGGGALILAPVYLAFLAGRGAFRRRRGKIFGAVAVAAAALAGTHALFDFSLQIPAVGVLLYAVLGAGVAQSWRGEDEESDPRMSA